MKKQLTKVIGLIYLSFNFTFAYGQVTKVNVDEAQKIGEGKKSEIFESPLISKKNVPTGDLEWTPTLVAKAYRVTHNMPYKEELMAMKAEKAIAKTSYGSISGDVEEEEDDLTTGTPVVGNEFAGNPNNGSSPMDNSIAISNGGIIISVANTSIQYKNMSGGTTYNNSIVDFINDPAIDYVCDPVVLYDPQADRFIFFAQECSGHSSNSNLLIMFSQTNDPSDGWNYYKLTGNPLADNSWFDYPKLAISDEELFITGNLFSNSGIFREPIIYQMEKNDGYSGTALTWQYWSDIPGAPSTILVVSSGSEFNYGPGIYAVSTQPFSGSAIKFYDITDAISGSPSLNYYSVSTSSYEVAADSDQQGTSCKLDNGDCRSLSGFYLNGVIHFVFHSDAGSGWNGINYNRLNVTSLSNTSNMFDAAGSKDYSYPSISWFGLGAEDRAVLIGFGVASSSIYPEMRVVHCDDLGNWSAPTLVQTSNSYASFTSDFVERWGDYTGIAKKYNSPDPSVWLSGSYGTGSHVWNSWIAEIHENYNAGITDNNLGSGVNIGPNPVVDMFNLWFETPQDIPVKIEVIGVDGQVVKLLYEGTAFAGKNSFAFNKANLAAGTYFVQIMSEQNQIANEKIIIQ